MIFIFQKSRSFNNLRALTGVNKSDERRAYALRARQTWVFVFRFKRRLLRHGIQIGGFHDRCSPGRKGAFVHAIPNPKGEANFLATLKPRPIAAQTDKKLTPL